MSKLLRYHQSEDTCFVTTVTKGRKNILVENVSLLTDVIRRQEESLEFRVVAYVTLPDHLHILIEGKGIDLSTIMRRIKLSFSKLYRDKYDMKQGHIWQHRFWDHIIRNQDDMNRHIDYIHYNPVKHGYVKRPFDGNIHRYIITGIIIRMIGGYSKKMNLRENSESKIHG